MGLLHIYCGDGKGKTTASLGLAMRAYGAGMKVWFVQFMKGGETSELNVLDNLTGLTVMRCDRQYGFFANLTEREKNEISVCHNELLKRAFLSDADMIILDEFNAAYGYGLLDRKMAEGLILGGREKAEIVLTGRNPAEIFVNEADYISEICCVRHPYEKGIFARKGVEY